jgi:hypothetical protein
MPTIEVQVRRFSVVSFRPFEEIVKRLMATIGHPDMNAFHSAVAAARTVADLEEVVQGAIGSSDLMEFVRFDAGEVLRKERGGQGPKIVRLVVGNPLIMKEMAKTVPDAASYAPVTILVDERADGVHLSCDSMATSLPTGVRQLSWSPGISTRRSSVCSKRRRGDSAACVQRI